jgi:hypothetical protein
MAPLIGNPRKCKVSSSDRDSNCGLWCTRKRWKRGALKGLMESFGDDRHAHYSDYGDDLGLRDIKTYQIADFKEPTKTKPHKDGVM